VDVPQRGRDGFVASGGWSLAARCSLLGRPPRPFNGGRTVAKKKAAKKAAKKGAKKKGAKKKA
jgi:hypothetical protein